MANYLGTDSAVFTNPQPQGGVTISGVGSSEFIWGGGPNGSSSTLGFGPAVINTPLNTPFKLGTLTFYDGSNVNGTSEVEFNISANVSSGSQPTQIVTLNIPLALVSKPGTTNPIASADTVALGQLGYAFHVEKGHTASVDLYGMLNASGSSSPSSLTITGLENPTTGGFVTALTITGAKGGQTVASGASISPFTNVTVADSAANLSQTLTVSLSSPANGTLSNLSGGSYNSTTGTYAVTGSLAAIDAALRRLVFTPKSGKSGTTNFTITDTDSDGAKAVNTTTSVNVEGGGATPPGTGPGSVPSYPITGVDNSTGRAIASTSNAVNFSSSNDSYTLTSSEPGASIVVGEGNNTLHTTGNGNVVVSGGALSQIIHGSGTGNIDFLNTQNQSFSWDADANFQSGDVIALIGAGSQNTSWTDLSGPAGSNYSGLTLMDITDNRMAFLSLPGLTKADLASGKIAYSFGTDPANGQPFALIVHS